MQHFGGIFVIALLYSLYTLYFVVSLTVTSVRRYILSSTLTMAQFKYEIGHTETEIFPFGSRSRLHESDRSASVINTDTKLPIKL